MMSIRTYTHPSQLQSPGGGAPHRPSRLTAIDPSNPTQHPSASCRLLPRLLALLLLLLLPAMVVPESANGLMLMCCLLKAPPPLPPFPVCGGELVSDWMEALLRPK